MDLVKTLAEINSIAPNLTVNQLSRIIDIINSAYVIDDTRSNLVKIDTRDDRTCISGNINVYGKDSSISTLA